jgi:hypothetical protein
MLGKFLPEVRLPAFVPGKLGYLYLGSAVASSPLFFFHQQHSSRLLFINIINIQAYLYVALSVVVSSILTDISHHRFQPSVTHHNLHKYPTEVSRNNLE